MQDHGAWSPHAFIISACPPLLGAQARPQLNKMWQETMNQEGEGIHEAALVSGSKYLCFCFQACSNLLLLPCLSQADSFSPLCLLHPAGYLVTARSRADSRLCRTCGPSCKCASSQSTKVAQW